MAGKLYKILILEHAPTDAELLELQIQKSGINFASKRVGTKELFLSTYAVFAPDLVLANLSLPQFDVLAALTQAQTADRKVPWVIVSSANNEEVAVNCMKIGAVDYVAKRNLSRLGAAVKSALERGLPPTTKESGQESIEEGALEMEARADFFQLVVESAKDLIAVLDLDGKRIYNNPSYEDLLEEPDLLRGTDSFLDVYPEDREMIRRVFHESIRTGYGKKTEYRLVDQLGQARYMESQGAVMKDAEGRSTGIVVVSRDINERKEAETGFQNLVAGTSSVTGDEFFTALVRHLAHALQVRYVLVSECMARSRERVRSLAYWANDVWLPAFEYDVAGTTCEKVLREGTMCYYPEHVQQLFPGENALAAMQAVSYLGIPLFGASGEVIGHMFVMDDKPLADFPRAKYILSLFAARAASELGRKHLHEYLRKNEERLWSILESLGAGLIVTDIYTMITYVNPFLANMLGYRAGEMVGKLASSLLLKKEEWEDLQRRNQERRRGTSERYETRLTRKDGAFFRSLLLAAPLTDLHGEVTGMLAIVVPIEPVQETPPVESTLSADL